MRLKEAAAGAEGVAYEDAVRHLFGLDEADGGPTLLRVGTRGSRLAMTQAGVASDALRRAGADIALVPITTAGDRDRTRPFGQIGERGVFVKELEEALLAERIDVAVHSAKDMTSTDTEGLVVGAYLPREDPRDALCGAAALRPGMRIGTASVRRRAQLLALRAGAWSSSRCAATSTPACRKAASAASTRSCSLRVASTGSTSAAEIGRRFDPEELLPEAGQGALALQVRAGRRVAGGGARRRGDARGASRPSEPASPRSAEGAWHRWRRITTAVTLTAMVADEDGRWVERRSGDDPGARRGGARASSSRA